MPYIHHVNVIKAAIKGKTNVVTTSYISPGIRELEEETGYKAQRVIEASPLLVADPGQCLLFCACRELTGDPVQA